LDLLVGGKRLADGKELQAIAGRVMFLMRQQAPSAKKKPKLL